MSILSNSMSDPLFKEVWEVKKWRWGNGILGLNKDIVETIAALLQQTFESDVWWGSAMGQCTAAHWVYEKTVPEKYWKLVDELNQRLVQELQKIDDGIKYVRIKYDTLIQGAGHHIPNIEVEFDYRWFGYDPAEAKIPPHNGTHISTAKIIICHDTRNYQGYQASKPDAKPIPKFANFFPDYQQWEKAGFFNIHRSKDYIIFPGDETDFR